MGPLSDFAQLVTDLLGGLVQIFYRLGQSLTVLGEWLG